MYEASAVRKHSVFPITVHQLFLTAPQPTFGATRVVDFQLLTTDFKAVTALSGSFGHSWEAEGTEGNSPAKAKQYMRGRSSAG